MGAQFRSKFVFVLLSTIDQTIDVGWHYNETHNGKGHFVKSGSMKAVFTNYSYIIVFVFLLFSLKVPFVNINLSDGHLTFRLGCALILALISSNMF